MLDDANLAALAGHLGEVLGGSVAIGHCHRIHGGASRETYSIDATVNGVPRGLILRRDPADSLIDTERALEVAAYRSFEGSPVPVPTMISLVESNDLLGAPFFVMDRIDGGETASPSQPQPFGEHRDTVGRQFFGHLGAIHAPDPLSTPLAGVVDAPALDTCWSRELDYWEGVINADELEPQPVGRAAIRALRRNPPPPAARLSIVHGDYRNGNYLHDGKGKIIAILDWEMAHIGDAHEDLGWAMDPMWAMKDEVLAAGFIPREEAIRAWEATSGQRFNPESYRWWSLFSHLKGLAIWISSAKSYASGANMDPVLGMVGLWCIPWHNKAIAHRLAGGGI